MTRRAIRHSAFARRYAAALLRLYPSHVRTRFGDDMTRDFLDTYASRSTAIGRLRFLLGATNDAVRSAIAERREARSDAFSGDLQPAGRAMMHGVFDDVRFGFRALWHRPGFSAAVVVTLALGIGANTAVFSMIDAIFIRPVAIADPAPCRHDLSSNVVGVTQWSDVLYGVRRSSKREQDPRRGRGTRVELDDGHGSRRN
jgi:hypothetical protein